jgi:hypothetical protein
MAPVAAVSAVGPRLTFGKLAPERAFMDALAKAGVPAFDHPASDLRDEIEA